ncbi:aldose 1-epimerase [Bacteroides thetaiotaomicron]|nr:aldose 1-epimerase [Bacteroides thetaiotaomicron]
MTTGEIAPVKDTPMDFTTPKAVGKDINNYDFVQLKNGNGYDHNWVLNTKGDISQVAARLRLPKPESHWKYIPTNRVFRYTQVTSSTEP